MARPMSYDIILLENMSEDANGFSMIISGGYQMSQGKIEKERTEEMKCMSF